MNKVDNQVNNIAELLQKIPPIFTGKEKDSVQMKNVAHLKRAVEYYLYDPDFRKKFDNDADDTLKNYAIEASAKDVEILVNARAAKEISSNPEKIPLAVWQYYSFFAEKLQWRDNSQLVRCVPENTAFKKWRQRQVNRSWGEFNGENSSFIHVPLVFELSLGCSVGCPFCALSSEQLQKIFRATEDNIELWKAILEISKEIIGSAAGEGVCYFATEPLDNPDYEVFSGLFRKILGRTPQITTAVAMRNPERTRNLILDSLNGPPIIHRFSILNLQTFRDICNSFTPEELLYVELLARFEESLTYDITKAGRSFDENALSLTDRVANTISCASGFIVNMAEQSIRLTTPCSADKEHPTGEIIFPKVYFSDADDFRNKILQIIKEEMPMSMDMQKVLKLQNFYRIEETGEGVNFVSTSKFVFKLKEQKVPYFYKETAKMLAVNTYTGRQIALAVSEKTNADIAEIFNFLRLLYNAGIVEYKTK